MSFWQPRSVYSSVLVGFFTALARSAWRFCSRYRPWKTWRRTPGRHPASYRDHSPGPGDTNRTAPVGAPHPSIPHLFDPELAQLAQEERAQLLQQLQELQDLVNAHGVDATALADLLNKLDLAPVSRPGSADTNVAAMQSTSSLDHSFAIISEHRRGLQQWLRTAVDELQDSTSAQAEVVINSLFAQLIFLAFATLALLLLFSYWINKPVQKLSQEIHKLGTTGLSHTISISGPRKWPNWGANWTGCGNACRTPSNKNNNFSATYHTS